MHNLECVFSTIIPLSPKNHDFLTAAGQQTSAEVSAAWAAYFAQYSNLINQAGAQPGATGMPYAGQNLMGASSTQQVPQPEQPLQQQQQQPQQPQPPSQQVQPNQGAPQQDYTDQWIEFYIMNGRPDYAEQIIEMKKQQHALKPPQ